MQFTESTPRRTITIKGAKFEFPAPYVAGYAISENEANALNGLLGENLRNNFVGKYENEDGTLKPEATQEAFEAYAAEYEFGARRSGGREASLSPVERKARAIAREKVNAALKQANKKIDLKTDEGKATMEKLVSELAKRADIVKEAEKQVRAVEKIAVEELDLGSLGLGEAQPQQQEAA